MATTSSARAVPLAAVPACGPGPARSRRPVGLCEGSGLRLTRRGRVVLGGLVGLVLIAVCLVAVALVAASGGPAGAFSGVQESAPLEVHVVAPGETLWGIAGQVAPDGDRAETVWRIAKINAVQGGVLHPGQRLVLPRA